MYIVVTNIPTSFRTPDLRNFFSLYIEKEAFTCFHFRHRPIERFREVLLSIKQHESSSSNQDESVHSPDEGSHTKETPNENDSDTDQDKTTARGKNHWLTSGLSGLSSLINETKKKAKQTSEISSRYEKGGPSKSQDGEGSTLDGEASNTPIDCLLRKLATAEGTCCVVDIKDQEAEGFISMYNKKHWVDRQGDIHPMKSYIYELNINSSLQDEDYKTRNEINSERLVSPTISALIEFYPPPIMPQGSVGTTTAHFKGLIRSCQLPGSIITKLGLDFPRSRGKKRFGQVPFDYGTDVVKPEDTMDTGDGVAFTAAGHLIPSSVDFTNPRNKPRKKLRNKPDKSYGPPQLEQQEEEEDGAEVEEWERYETFHNDVTSQDRTKERLYEKEIELTWEKGGPGLVFYTDAQVWREQEGDFDEQTADEWDVDMSGYYEKGAGDKDARDSIAMLNSNKLRAGHLTQSVFKSPKDANVNRKETKSQRKKGPTMPPKIGEFESHTKGFGRKLMEAMGWQEGRGLGRDAAGLPYALGNDGQHPQDKKGFGYHGERLQGWGGRGTSTRQPPEPQLPSARTFPIQARLTPGPQPLSDGTKVRISTVFDRPLQEDPPPPTLRSQEPTVLSFRHYIPSSEAPLGYSRVMKEN